jgi:hypothetical protein
LDGTSAIALYEKSETLQILATQADNIAEKEDFELICPKCTLHIPCNHFFKPSALRRFYKKINNRKKKDSIQQEINSTSDAMLQEKKASSPMPHPTYNDPTVNSLAPIIEWDEDAAAKGESLIPGSVSQSESPSTLLTKMRRGSVLMDIKMGNDTNDLSEMELKLKDLSQHDRLVEDVMTETGLHDRKTDRSLSYALPYRRREKELQKLKCRQLEDDAELQSSEADAHEVIDHQAGGIIVNSLSIIISGIYAIIASHLIAIVLYVLVAYIVMTSCTSYRVEVGSIRGISVA